ncbi:MAG: NAD-dependent epimerase/dehydratase family protein [Gammaproteobacteria bacterium]|nr:NAD-dependent epimerase/dehydratase family protein [Gammaproteobacteria bacterium]
MEKSDRLLIVGGTGFIGRSVAIEAVNRRFDVSIISKNHCPKLKQVKGVEYIAVDIAKKKDLLIELKDRTFDYVINLGGYIDHCNYFDGGDKVFNVHFNGIVNLVNCIDKNNLKGFIQIGSSDEYGNNPAPQNEIQRELPISPYSFAKAASTHFLQMLFRTEKYPVVILRPFLVYGPEQGDNRFIPQIIKGCLDNQKFPTSKGEQLRDFCFIDDIVQAIFCALNGNIAYGEVINIASGKPVPIKKMIDLIVSVIGSGRPQFGQIPYRKGENMSLYADITKAKKLLNWSPAVGLEQGLEETIKWVKSNNG